MDSEKIIDIVGERKILNYIMSMQYISYLSLNEVDIYKRKAIEYYIIKYRNDINKKIYIENYLDHYVKMFEQSPHLYIGSSLLNYISVPNFFTDNQSTIIKKGINNVVLRCKDIYTKYKSNFSVTEEEKQILMKYLSCTLVTKNLKLQKVQQKCVKIILSKKENLSIYEKEFLANYVCYFMINKRNTECKKPNIYLSELKDSLGGFQLYNNIFINTKPNKLNSTLPLFIEVVCHETKHVLQNYDSKKNPDNYNAFCYARKELFTRYINTPEYDSYKAGKNYRFEEIEIDAEKDGFWYSRIFLREFGYSKEAKNLQSEHLIREENRKKHYEYKTTKDNHYVPSQHFNVLNLNNIVLKNPNVLNEYPVLNRIYDKNGNVKNLKDFLTEPCNLNEADKHKIYNDYIIYEIHKNDGLKKISIGEYNLEQQKNIFNKIIYLISIETEKILAIIKDLDTNIDKNLKQNIFNYHVNLIVKMIDFINSNYYRLKEIEKTNPSVYDSVHFKSDIKTLKLNIFVNKSDIDVVLLNKVESLQNILDLVFSRIDNYDNLDYMRELLSGVDEGVLESKIELLNGNRISLRQYLEKYVAPTISSHKILHKNRWISVRDYINEILNKKKEPKKI